MTKYDELTDLVRALTDDERGECIQGWYESHEDETRGDEHLDLLTDDLMCQCCGVDYSGYDRDLLNADGSAPADFDERRALWVAVADRLREVHA